MDKDLISIQEARDLVNSAQDAWVKWRQASQVDVDRVCQAMADAGFQASERLGRLAQEETGFGVAAHKKLKNEFGSRIVWESIRNLQTVGILRHDPQKKLFEIAWPMGVVAALTPSTNPTSTALFKCLIAVKSRNAIVFSPHPFAKACTYEAIRVMASAAEAAGAPKGLMSCMQSVSLRGTQELMTHSDTAVILATGGTDMVRAAHSTGKPAYGVGPGNVPVYVDRSADLEKAARYIVSSKAFDYSTICATEQAVIADAPIAARLAELMRSAGAYFTDPGQTDALRKLVFNPNGGLNTKVVGKSAEYVAGMAGFQVPVGTRVLVTPLVNVGNSEPLSHEKMTTVLAWYTADGWEMGCELSIAVIRAGGMGHTQIIHANDEKVIMAFGLEKPVFRILVNTMGTLGAIGYTTGVVPSLTLGPGGVGGAITGDNLSANHLLNIKRLAYETIPPPLQFYEVEAPLPGRSPVEIERIVKQVLNEILSTR